MGQMKTKCSSSATGLFFLLLMIVSFSSCTRTQKDIIPSAEYAPYINAYTGGVISQNSTIRIELTHEQPMVDLNNELKENPFSFSPSLKGKAYWVSNNTIEFVPEEGTLKPGSLYECTFQLGKFVEVDKKLKEFNFSFRVQERNFTLSIEPLPITDAQPDEINIKGEICFSDIVKKEEVEKILTVKDGNNKSYPVEIIPTDNLTRYQFCINQVPRDTEDYQLNSSDFLNPLYIFTELLMASCISLRSKVIIHKLEYPKLMPGKNFDGKIIISSILVFFNKSSRSFVCILTYKNVSGIIKDNLPFSFNTDMHLNKNKE